MHYVNMLAEQNEVERGCFDLSAPHLASLFVIIFYCLANLLAHHARLLKQKAFFMLEKDTKMLFVCRSYYLYFDNQLNNQQQLNNREF